MTNFVGFISRRAKPDWNAAIWGGVIAGAAFMMLEMILVATVGGESPWGPPRMIAAIVLGKAVLPPPATFDFAIVLAAMAVHFVLSIGLGVLFATIASRMTTGTAIIAGAIFGIAIYIVNFYGFTVLFPWFAMARNWMSIFSHAVFGIVLAWAYKLIEQPQGRAA